MQRVESGPAMTALFADHGVLSVSTFAPSSHFSSVSSPVLPTASVSIIRLSTTLLLSGLVLLSLVLSSPAGR
jgi:hypothetical protein